MTIRIDRFQGELPGIDPVQLPENNAAVAFNCRLETGAIKPLRAPVDYADVTKAGVQKSLYRFNPEPGDMASGSIFTWPDVVDVVRTPVRENQEDIICYTGDAYPKITNADEALSGAILPANAYQLGLDGPAQAPTVAVEGTPSEDVADQRSRDYVVTYLFQLGSYVMESAPTIPTEILDISGDQTVRLTDLPPAPGGNINVTGLRLYRRVTSGQNQRFFRVTDLAIGATEYVDSVTESELSSDVLISTLWDRPPGDMHSLGVLPNGFLFGASGQEVCVSESYRPHAWNAFNRVPVGEKVIGTGQLNGAIVALTARNPFLITGSNPSALTAIEIEIMQGVSSKRSIVSGIFGCAYASPDGLVLVSQQGSGVVTDEIIRRDEWQAYNPSSLLGAMFEGEYVGFFDNGTPQAFILDPEDKQKGFTFTDQHATAAYHDPLADSLFVIQGDKVRLWDSGAALTYRWRSKPFVFNQSMTMTAGRVLAEDYNDITYRLIVDGVQRHEQTVTNNRPFRMPSGYAGRSVQIEVEGTSVIQALEAAPTVSELA